MRTLCCVLSLLLPLHIAEAAPVDSNLTKAVRSTLQRFVEANTANPPGNESRVVAIAEERLAAAGIPYETFEFAPGRKNIVARLRGSGSERPMLLIAHTDVVSAEGQSWTKPAHDLTEDQGYLYGRGVLDDLGRAAVYLEVVIYLKSIGAPLRRDVILALTGDEEMNGAGVRHLIANRPDLIDAEFAISEGAGVALDSNGMPLFNPLQVAEKVYQDFELTATGTPGHSSVPLQDNAIGRLSRALARLDDYQRPARLMPAMRAYYQSLSSIEVDPARKQAMKDLANSAGPLPSVALEILQKNPTDSANLRTTCVITTISGGSGVNALPAQAKANVNCRMLPDESIENLKSDLEAVINDRQVVITESGTANRSPPTPHDSPVVTVIDQVTRQIWPNLQTIPTVSNYGTDSTYLRAHGIPSYGLTPFPMTEADAMTMHGADERLSISGLEVGTKYTYLLVLALAGGERDANSK